MLCLCGKADEDLVAFLFTQQLQYIVILRQVEAHGGARFFDLLGRKFHRAIIGNGRGLNDDIHSGIEFQHGVLHLGSRAHRDIVHARRGI